MNYQRVVYVLLCWIHKDQSWINWSLNVKTHIWERLEMNTSKKSATYITANINNRVPLKTYWNIQTIVSSWPQDAFIFGFLHCLSQQNYLATFNLFFFLKWSLFTFNIINWRESQKQEGGWPRSELYAPSPIKQYILSLLRCRLR